MDVFQLARKRFGLDDEESGLDDRRTGASVPTQKCQTPWSPASDPVDLAEPAEPDATDSLPTAEPWPVDDWPWELARCAEGCAAFVRGWCTAVPGKTYFNPAFLKACPKDDRIPEAVRRCVKCEHHVADGPLQHWCGAEPGRYRNVSAPGFRCPMEPAPKVVALGDVLSREETDRRVITWGCRTCPRFKDVKGRPWCTDRHGGLPLRWRDGRCPGPDARSGPSETRGVLIDEVLKFSAEGRWWADGEPV